MVGLGYMYRNDKGRSLQSKCNIPSRILFTFGIILQYTIKSVVFQNSQNVVGYWRIYNP